MVRAGREGDDVVVVGGKDGTVGAVSKEPSAVEGHPAPRRNEANKQMPGVVAKG